MGHQNTVSDVLCLWESSGGVSSDMEHIFIVSHRKEKDGQDPCLFKLHAYLHIWTVYKVHLI